MQPMSTLQLVVFHNVLTNFLPCQVKYCNGLTLCQANDGMFSSTLPSPCHTPPQTLFKKTVKLKETNNLFKEVYHSISIREVNTNMHHYHQLTTTNKV